MGWLWSSPSKTEKQQDASTQVSEGIGQPSAPPETSQDTQQARLPPSQPSTPLSRDEQAELEFRDLLRELDQPPTSISTLPRTSPTPRHAPSSSDFSFPVPDHDPDSIHPIALLPTSMSCRAAFDAAFYCQSLGGQFTNLYRYGNMRNCSDSWSNFWFCMRTNRSGYEKEEKGQRIRRHYWEMAERYRTGPSSEDVWDVRTRKVEGAFQGDYEAWEQWAKERMEGRP